MDHVHHHDCHLYTNRICWSAILAGALVGLGLGFLLHLYGNAIGLSAYSSSPSGASMIALGGFLGLVIGTIAAMLTSGFVAGYLGRYHYCHVSGGIIYGFITWSLSLFLSMLLSGSMMSYVAAYSDSLANNDSNMMPKVEVTYDKPATDDNLPVPTHKNTTDETAKKITPAELAGGGWIIFALFFIGAISTCVGAMWGMKCRKEEEPQPRP